MTRNPQTAHQLRKHWKRHPNPTCWLCGKPINTNHKWPHPMSLVVDHKTPLNQGGPDTLANSAPAHARCNLLKSDRLDGGPIIKANGITL